MSITISDGTDTVTFDVVKNVIPVVTKDIEFKTSYSGVIPVDRGRSMNSIQLSGTQYTSAYTNVEQLNTFMDDQSELELSGMDDSNMDGDYVIRNLSASAVEGYGEMYDFNIDMERVRD